MIVDPRCRRGFSLVELLTTITVLTIMLALAAGLLRVVLKLDGLGRDLSDTAADQARLDRALRADAHRAASSPPPVIQPERLTMILPDSGQVDYAIRPREIVREVQHGGKLQQREVFRRPVKSAAKFERVMVDGRPFVVLAIDRGSPGNTKPSTPEARIEVEVGRFERWVGGKP